MGAVTPELGTLPQELRSPAQEAGVPSTWGCRRGGKRGWHLNSPPDVLESMAQGEPVTRSRHPPPHRDVGHVRTGHQRRHRAARLGPGAKAAREGSARARGALAQRPPSPNEPRATAGSGGGLRPRGAWGPEGRPEGTEWPKEEKQRGASGRGARPSASPGPRGTSLPLPEAPRTTRFGGAARRPGPAPKKARTPGCASRKRGHGDRAPPPTTRAELLFPRRRSPWGQRGDSWSSGSSAAAESQPPPPP